MKLYRSLSLLCMTGILVACDGGDSSSDSSSEGPRPTITALNKIGALIPGTTVSAESECELCDPELTQYRWVVDRNENGKFGDKQTINNNEISDLIFNGKDFTVSEDDFGKRIKLIAKPFSPTTSGSQQHTIFQRIQTKTIAIASRGYAALKNDGTVVTWGWQMPDSSENITGIKEIVSGFHAFAGVTEEGGVIAWGKSDGGGDPSLGSSGDLTSGVTTIKGLPNVRAFAALKDDGSVVAWGEPASGGDTRIGSSGDLTSGVVDIVANEYAFAALKENGSVVAWGNPSSGGDTRRGSSGNLDSGVIKIVGNPYAFAALKANGSVVAWGDASNGGNIHVGSSGNLSFWCH